MKDLVIELMTFAALALGEPVPNSLPAIRWHQSQCSLDRDFYRDPERNCDPDNEGVAAFYRPSEDQIYLVRSFKRDDLFDRSVLVHELAHYVQDVSGHFDRYACGQEAEPDAYRVQDDWLKANGTSLKDFGVSQIRIMLLSQCGNPYEGGAHDH